MTRLVKLLTAIAGVIFALYCALKPSCRYVPQKESQALTIRLQDSIFTPAFSEQSPAQTNPCAWLQTIQDITCTSDGKICFTSSDGVFALAMTNGFDLAYIAELHQANRFNDNYRSYGIASSTNGNIYLADSYNHVIKVLQ